MTSKYLADTTLLVDHNRQVKAATDFIYQNRPAISLVTRVELIQGCKNMTTLQGVEKICRNLNVIPVSEEISPLAADLVANYYLSHSLEFNDALIATTTITHKLTLVTSNAKHFSFIPNLKLLSWQEAKKNLK